MHEALCARLQGHSVVVCACRTPDGFLPCPEAARRVLAPVAPPSTYHAVQVNRTYQPDRQKPPLTSITSRQIGGGYTGSICDQCGGMRMRRTGTCETCMDCGNAGGCG